MSTKRVRKRKTPYDLFVFEKIEGLFCVSNISFNTPEGGRAIVESGNFKVVKKYNADLRVGPDMQTFEFGVIHKHKKPMELKESGYYFLYFIGYFYDGDSITIVCPNGCGWYDAGDLIGKIHTVGGKLW